MSVLVWQYMIGVKLHWLVMVMSVIILLAVGSDYNLLLVARFKEEIGAGLKTGIIRAMGGTGRVVTAAGLVFAFTMASMMVSDNRAVGQVGTTIGLGLLFDTLVVRSFLMPSIAAMLGRWFWWPMNVASRPPRIAAAASRPTPVRQRRAETDVTAPLATVSATATRYERVLHRTAAAGGSSVRCRRSRRRAQPISGTPRRGSPAARRRAPSTNPTTAPTWRDVKSV